MVFDFICFGLCCFHSAGLTSIMLYKALWGFCSLWGWKRMRLKINVQFEVRLVWVWVFWGVSEISDVGLWEANELIQSVLHQSILYKSIRFFKCRKNSLFMSSLSLSIRSQPPNSVSSRKIFIFYCVSFAIIKYNRYNWHFYFTHYLYCLWNVPLYV